MLKYCLLNDKKYAQKVCSYDLVHEKTFRLSSHTPDQFNVMSRIHLCLIRGNVQKTIIIANY